jgi:tRNA-dihydrouridine synthase
MPFLSPTQHRALTPKEARELPKADSVSFVAVPQILTKHSEDFLWAASVCRDLGYDEVNLNLGCPSGTVVAKGKGSGMLRDLAALDSFLEEIFQAAPLPISVKTRIGVESAKEFPAILDIYNRYPMKELTIHPRVRKVFYKGDVEMESFRYAAENSKNTLCFNGNLNSLQDISKFSEEFPQIDAVMLGRGLIGDPGMLTGTTAAKLEAFHDDLLERYIEAFGGARNAMFRMKENWGFLLHRFENSEKLGKRLRKTTDVAEFKAITAEIFHTLPLAERLPSDW